MQQLHKAQISTLSMLRHTNTARFRDLRKAAGLAGDSFKFHLQALQKMGHIAKTSDGSYELTISGREFANNLDEKRRTIQKQPKVSVLIVASRQGADGQTEYLVQERRRSPYFGYIGCLSGPVQWGEDALVTAERELTKQTGLSADFVTRGLYRQTDYNAADDTILEDKLFIVIEALTTRETLTNAWQHGTNSWMTLQKLKESPQCFESSFGAIKMIERGEVSASATTYHDPAMY